MIFVNDISQLQQYNLCKNEKPYCETVIDPEDVLLQGRLPAQMVNNYTIQVFLMDCGGTVQIADVTSSFKYYLATSIYNFRYFNLQLVSWSPDFDDIGCFILKVVIKNEGVDVFNKLSEMYCKKDISILQSKCEPNLVKLESTFNCMDDISGYYYGDGQAPLTIPLNDNIVIYENRVWFPAELIAQPTDIKKEKTFLGKTQKVDYSPLFILNGLAPFPVWKMREIEQIFTGKRLFISGAEFVWKGGKLFDKDTIRCTCNWLFKTDLEGFPLTNEFSCLDTCNFLCSYFVIPAGQRDQPYYSENGTLISHFYDELLEYYRSYPDVIAVTDYGVPPTLNCEPVAIFKVEAFGNIPNFFYYGTSGAQNRLFAKRDDCTNPTRLCEGLSGRCEAPSGITSTGIVTYACEPPADITSTAISLDDWEDCTHEDIGAWETQAGFIFRHNNVTNKVQMMFTSRNVNYTDPNNAIIGNEPLVRLGADCRPYVNKFLDPTNTAGLPTNMQISIDNTGVVRVTGELTIGLTYGEITIPLVEFSKN